MCLLCTYCHVYVIYHYCAYKYRENSGNLYNWIIYILAVVPVTLSRETHRLNQIDLSGNSCKCFQHFISNGDVMYLW